MKENKGDYLKRIFPLEKATYLEIPRNVTLATLKKDIRKGAVHFKELQELLEKDKENEASKADNKAEIIDILYLQIAYYQNVEPVINTLIVLN